MNVLRRSIIDFKNRHQGEDLWVIGAAASMNYVSPRFFHNKITIGVNNVYRRFPCTYLVRKEQSGADEAQASGIPLLLSEYDCGFRSRGRNAVPGPAWYFSHAENDCDHPDLSVVGTDRIVVSYSTIGSALHLAAYMGAANILICGHDGGTLDGSLTFDSYHDEAIHVDWYKSFVRVAVRQSRDLRGRLREVYGCEIYSLNPFIGFDWEGHRFDPGDESMTVLRTETDPVKT